MNKRNKIIILIYSMLLITIFIIGISYAYFSAITSGDEGSSIIVQTADMRLLFTDGGELRLDNALPGAYVTKQFTVANIGNADALYNIRWKGIYNEFINSELIMKLECTAYDNQNVSQGSCGTLNDIVGYTTRGAIKTSIPIAVGITHRYTITITFIETGENQDYNQGKSFIGTLLIDTLDLNMTSIKGVLVDESNNILANKVIEIHSDPISTITNSKGEFLLEGIEYGNHEIIIKDNNTEIARKNIELTTTNNNSSVSDSISIHWNETQKSVVKVKIETGTNIITRIDIDWLTTDSRCFAYDSASTSITDYYCYSGNTKGLPTITDVVIPSTVTSIGGYAFSNNKLTSVTIPNSVTLIDYDAFAYNELTSITIPDSVTTIRGQAFLYNQLTSVTIPDSVTTIGYNAFRFNKLTNITIPNSVTTIETWAFYGNQLTSIDYPGGINMYGGVFNNNPLKLDDPIMYYKNKDGTYDNSIIIGCIADETSSVIIPDTVKTINYGVFYGSGLTNVIIPDSVTLIGGYAFSDNKLTSIIIPNSVKTIEYEAFSYNNLISVTIPNSITTIGDYVFQYNQLTSVTIPNSVKTIGDYAFYKSTDSNPNLSLIEIDNVSGAIEGSPWGAGDATITYLKTS